MSILRRPQQAEVRLTEHQRRYAAISTATLQYMLEYGISREASLRWQRGLLRFYAADEADLYEAMRLSERLSRVEGNVDRVRGENERLQAELISRSLGSG